MTAFHLAHNYPTAYITWIFPEDNKPIGVGEAIIPDVTRFFIKLGIYPKDLIRECNGTIKLGGVFVDWNPGEMYTFPFGYDTKNPKHNSAALDRIIATGKVPDDILEYTSLATHFRATDILKYLDKLVGNYKNLEVQRRTVTKEELEGTYDLLIDATGFNRSISYMPNNFVSIAHKVPNNRAFVFRHEYTDREKQCLPYTLTKAMNYGWCWNIPLGDQLAVGYVHDKKFDVKDEFIEYIRVKYGIEPDPAKIVSIDMVTGRNRIHMKDNVVSIGLASAFIEPLESTGLFLVTDALRILERYIAGEINEREYNRDINANFDTLVDFIVAHYKYSTRSNEYWDFYKSVPISKEEIPIFPSSGWDTILSAFLKEVKRPTEQIDPHTLLAIHKGTPYYQWIQDESNFT